MNRQLYLECYSGISGDMTVAALLDLGADEQILRKALASLPVGGFEIAVTRKVKSGLDVCDFDVDIGCWNMRTMTMIWSICMGMIISTHMTMSMYTRMEVYTHTSITTMTTVTSIITIMDIIMSTEGFMKSYILLSMQI